MKIATYEYIHNLMVEELFIRFAYYNKIYNA